MTPTRKSASASSDGYHRNARAHLKAAKDLLELAEHGSVGNPVMSSTVHAVISYCDALTSKYANVKNTDDHSSVPETLRKSLGQRADKTQLARLGRLIARKSEIEYDHRQLSMSEARKYLENAERFCEWAEGLL